MDRALVRNLQQARPLFVAEHTREFDLAVDVVEPTFSRFAILAVGGVNLQMPKPHGYGLERPALASRIERQGHRGASSERCEQQVVRVRSGIRPSDGGGLVGHKPMSSDGNLLCEARRAAV